MGFEWRDIVAAWGAIVATIVAILRVWDKYKERERLYLGYQLVSDSDKTKPVEEWRLTATNVGTKPVVVVAFGVFDFPSDLQHLRKSPKQLRKRMRRFIKNRFGHLFLDPLFSEEGLPKKLEPGEVYWGSPRKIFGNTKNPQEFMAMAKTSRGTLFLMNEEDYNLLEEALTGLNDVSSLFNPDRIPT